MGAVDSKHATAFAALLRRLEPQPNGCWLWRGAVDQNGYGRLEVGRQQWRAHRLAAALSGSRLTPSTHVDHVCETPLCANPAHLRVVTPAENNRRRRDAKLNERMAQAIRSLAAEGVSNAALGRAFGVSRQMASYIAHGNCWKEAA